MPELPEITVLARQAHELLSGKKIDGVTVVQPKCLNLSSAEMESFLQGRTMGDTTARGKWLFIDLDPPGHLLINLGMGGDLLYRPDGCPDGGREASSPAERFQFGLSFAGGAGLTARFWWFGYVHAVAHGRLSEHALTASLGPSPLDPAITPEVFRAMIARKARSRVKSFLLDQKNLAGIGNVYAQDPLWLARLHPDRLLGSLSGSEADGLLRALRAVLESSVEKGGLAYEKDLLGQPGGYGREDFKVAYKPGEPCPTCGTAVEKVRTGCTSSYICPACQAL